MVLFYIKMIKINYLFYILIILITLFLFYHIYNKYNNNILKRNIVRKINNSYELFNNINNELFSNNKSNIVNINKIEDLIEYSYYKSNKHDTYDMLNRELNLYDISNVEHMSIFGTNEEQNINDLFPDLNKSEFSMSPTQSTTDLLVKPEFEADIPKMTDALLNMDTRPDEQKELDSLLDDLNTYLYLLKNSIINDLNNKKDIGMNQKIILYYNLFKDTKYMAMNANNIYNSNKEISNYTIDTNLDKKSELYLSNLSSSLTTIYSNIK